MESKNPDSPISFDGSKTNHYHKPDAKPVIEEKKRKNNPTAANAIVVAINSLLSQVSILAFLRSMAITMAILLNLKKPPLRPLPKKLLQLLSRLFPLVVVIIVSIPTFMAAELLRALVLV